jgi:hypothetical protein
MSQVAPHLLSRDYEDRLDWLENQRRDKTKRNRGQRVLAGMASLLVTVFAFLGLFPRKR